MDSGKALAYYGSHSKIQRNEGCVLSRRALTVVVSSHYYAFAGRLCSFRESLVAYGETVLRKMRYVGAVRQYLGSRRHDVVCGDVVANLENKGSRKRIFQRLAVRERLDVRTSQNRKVLRLL
jgi:hypothetical protein